MPRPSSGTIRVLHVDDEPEFAKMSATFLEREDDRFAVETVTSPEDGMERLPDDVDCIVSDYDMPGTTGIEFLETVREDYPDLPFVLFTGKGSEEVASEAISAGVTDYLQKKTSTDQFTVLANRVRNAVDRYQFEREAERTSERLQRQNDLFEKAQSLASVGAWEYDLRSGEPFWTDEVARIHELSPEYDHTVEEAIEFYHPEDRPAIREAFDRAMTEGESYDLELRLITAEGNQRWVRTRGEPQYDDGEIVTVRGSFQDVTERKDLERRADRLADLADSLGHDLREPLDALGNALKSAEKTGDPEQFERCHRSVDRMRRRIDDLVTLARYETLDEPDPVSLADVAETNWRYVEQGEANLEVVTDREIPADRGRLGRLMEHLFRNAVENGGAGVTVTVGGLTDGFYVADDGPGIPEDDREDVFESGFATSEGRAGLGLAVVEDVVAKRAWAIDVTESESGGARFEITGIESDPA